MKILYFTGDHVKMLMTLTEFLELGLKLPEEKRNSYHKASRLLAMSGRAHNALKNVDFDIHVLIMAIQSGEMVPTIKDLQALADGKIKVYGFGPKRIAKLQAALDKEKYENHKDNQDENPQ